MIELLTGVILLILASGVLIATLVLREMRRADYVRRAERMEKKWTRGSDPENFALSNGKAKGWKEVGK